MARWFRVPSQTGLRRPEPPTGRGVGNPQPTLVFAITSANFNIDVINTGFSIPAKYGHLGKAKDYDFKRKRHDKYYEQKRVEVFYVIEKDVIVTVTVYVFYGKWKGIK